MNVSGWDSGFLKELRRERFVRKVPITEPMYEREYVGWRSVRSGLFFD
jgi:hypothetical protein